MRALLDSLAFPALARPPVPYNALPTFDLISWSIRVHAFAWLCHTRVLLKALLTLLDDHNVPAARIIGRAVFKLGAHAHYAHKHLKQHLDAHDLPEAWKFLLPIGTGSRYIDSQFPQNSELFPSPVHISKVINCFTEVYEDANDSYSFLSEFCHPNLPAYYQHYEWTTSTRVEFRERTENRDAALGSVVAAMLLGLMAVEDLLRLIGDKDISPKLVRILADIAKPPT
jgi:hypothetical protein